MSLSSQLKNENSLVSRFVAKHMNREGVAKFVERQNLAMADRLPLVTDNADPALVGTAFGYAFRWHMAMLDPGRSIAVDGARKIGQEELARRLIREGNGTPELRPSYAVALGLFETVLRGHTHEWLKQLTTLDTAHTLPSMEDEPIRACIADVAKLSETIRAVWSAVPSIALAKWADHPTFDGSADVGGADANAIYGDMLIDVRTSRKRDPFTQNDLVQQFMYAVLDYSDKYRLKRIGWYFARQKILLVVPLDRIVRDMQAAREDFQDMASKEVGEHVLADVAMMKLADRLNLSLPEGI